MELDCYRNIISFVIIFVFVTLLGFRNVFCTKVFFYIVSISNIILRSLKDSVSIELVVDF